MAHTSMRPVPWWANWVLALASLLLFGGIAEGVCRLVDLRPRGGPGVANPPWMGERWLLPRSDYQKRLRDAGFLGRYFRLYEWDRYLFYRLRPDRHLKMIDPFATEAGSAQPFFYVETNDRGYRTPEFADAPARPRRRIVSLGDSSTFGWGVEGNEAYPERMRIALSERPELAGGVETLNLGVPGYSTFQGRVQLERIALPLQPDLVTFSFIANDGAMTGQSDRAAYAQRVGWQGALLAALHHSRAFETFEAWFEWASAKLSPPPPPEQSGRRNVASLDEAGQNVREAVALARGAGVPIVIVGQCVRHEAAEILAGAAGETGVPFFDATAFLDERVADAATAPEYATDRKRAEAEYGRPTIAKAPYLVLFRPDGCHPSAAGHERVGRALAERVAPLLAGGAPR